MKKRDIITIIISVVIFIVAAGLAYRYFVPPPQNSGIQVEIPHPVDPNFNQDQLNTLKNDVQDFSPDLTPKDNGNKPVIQ
jgi:hypothetical protein